MTKEEENPTADPIKGIKIATKSTIDQMLIYLAQVYSMETISSEDLILHYILSIINTVSIYMDNLPYENRVIVESAIKEIISDSTYSEEEIKLAKMPVMGNA